MAGQVQREQIPCLHLVIGIQAFDDVQQTLTSKLCSVCCSSESQIGIVSVFFIARTSSLFTVVRIQAFVNVQQTLTLKLFSLLEFEQRISDRNSPSFYSENEFPVYSRTIQAFDDVQRTLASLFGLLSL